MERWLDIHCRLRGGQETSFPIWLSFWPLAALLVSHRPQRICSFLLHQLALPAFLTPEGRWRRRAEAALRWDDRGRVVCCRREAGASGEGAFPGRSLGTSTQRVSMGFRPRRMMKIACAAFLPFCPFGPFRPFACALFAEQNASELLDGTGPNGPGGTIESSPAIYRRDSHGLVFVPEGRFRMGLRGFFEKTRLGVSRP